MADRVVWHAYRHCLGVFLAYKDTNWTQGEAETDESDPINQVRWVQPRATLGLRLVESKCFVVETWLIELCGMLIGIV